MGIAEEIQSLNDLKRSGAISEDEYQEAKRSILDKYQPAGEKFSRAVAQISSDVNRWSMFIHLSQLCGYIIPVAGLIVPIILWQIKKGDSETVDIHGRIVINWIISVFIYGVVFGLLSLILIGIPLLYVLAALAIAFPIIGGLKANKGEVWPYPFSIKFFRLN